MKASEYGLPQLRPRVFIVGFKNDVLKTFMFPDRIPLQLTMSDIFNGHCLRKVGFTLRVGGRGSTINDRRNWEFYHVDNTIQRVTSKEAKKMQGFPDNFYFPVSEVKAMKQLGNSVAINVVYSVAKEVVTYLKNLENYKEVLMKNKGEWSELFVFVKLLHDKCIHLADKKLQKQNDKLEILKLTTENCNLDFVIDNKNSFVKIINKKEGSESILDISSIYNESTLSSIFNSIANASGSSFNIPEFNTIRHKLGLSFIKSGNSLQKSDILISFKYNNIEKYNDGFGIKSYIGSTATLLNASSNTNFLFHIEGLDKNKVEEINAINSKEKIKDRISKIYEYGGHLIFDKAEKDTMQYNLKMIDIYMPEIIGECLLFHYNIEFLI